MRAIMSNSHPKRKPAGGRAFIKLLLVTMLILAVFILAAMSPVFQIREIRVHGNRRYAISEVVNASGVEKGRNGFLYVGGGSSELISLRCGEAEERIKNVLPYVENVKVKYVIPDMVVIELSERESDLVVPYMTAFLLIDSKGNVLDSVKEAESLGLPIVKGIEVESFKLGQALVMKNGFMFASITRLMDTIKDSDNTSSNKILDSIDYFEASGYEIHFRVDSRITVKVPMDGDFEYIMRFLKEIINKNISDEEKGVLDFTTGANPVFTPERREE
jgi:cell division septal protein FtsQ